MAISSSVSRQSLTKPGQTTSTRPSRCPEIGQLSRRQIAKLVGIAPLNNDSGKHRGERHIWGGRADVRTPSVYTKGGSLSGGNQQKVSVGKWLAANTSILIVDEPTVGVDVRTKAAFHDLITELADRGLTIVLISSDLPEMVSLADRILVLRAYGIVAELENTKRYETMSVGVMSAIHGAEEAAALAAAAAGGATQEPARA